MYLQNISSLDSLNLTNENNSKYKTINREIKAEIYPFRDMLVSTILFRKIKKYPQQKIVSIGKDNKEAMKYNACVD